MPLLAALVVARGGLAFYGYDRQPVVTSNDEIYWAEPAWSLLHGQGYRMPCCDGTLFGEWYPQHPPVYVGVLAASFKLFGFTPAAMRLPSLLAHVAGVAVMLLFLRRLQRLRLLDRRGFIAAATLLLTNYTTLWLSRWGRPDPFCFLFAATSFLVLFGGPMHGRALQRRALIAGLFIGLALGTHTISIFYFGLYVVILWLLRGRLRRTAWLLMPVPCVLFAGIWFATFGERSLEALYWHRAIAKQMGGADASPWRLVTALQRRNPQAFVQAGGTTALLVVGTAVLWLLRLRRARQFFFPPRLALGLGFAGLMVMIVLLTGLGVTRANTYFPFAVVAIGLLLSHWRTRPGARSLVVAGVAALVLAEVGQIGYATLRIHREYDSRVMTRHDDLLDRIALHQPCALCPPLWFQARSRGLDIQLIETAIPMMSDYWVQRADFSQFKSVVVIADPRWAEHPGLADRPRTVETELGSAWWVFWPLP